MSDVIQLLPDSVANQIAAGEVIQRPASVIKELVENSVDAGAHNIDVLVSDAGRTAIQVIDDGKGMSETDARLSFERHATSKIRKADDLFTLHTMGFRGEALPSIAAVAQVELKTRMESDEVGTHLSIAGSRVTGQEPCSCPVGSNFLVENLFFNVPARRKFLKSNTTELNNIISAFEKIALVYPEIKFTLRSNDALVYDLTPGSTRQRIVEIFGKRLNQFLLPVKVDTTICRISGFVGKPESARKKGAKQYFFVNGRYMKHPYFNKAIMTAYDRLIPIGEQVPYFIYFDVPPENIDVNIHPTKTEIKFENDQSVWQILMAAVKETIGVFNDVSAIDFDTEGKPDIPVFDGSHQSSGSVSMPKVNYNPSYNPFDETPVTPDMLSSLPSSLPDGADGISALPQSFGGFGDAAGGTDTAAGGSSAAGCGGQSHAGGSHVPSQWDALYSGALDGNEPAEQSVFSSQLQQDGTAPGTAMNADGSDGKSHEATFKSTSADAAASPAQYQYKGRYIMTAVKSGLMVVDQHRAHVRILYEEYLERLKSRQTQSQKNLFPEIVKLPASDSVVLGTILEEMRTLGFDLTDMGDNSYAINGIPAGLEGLDMPSLIGEMVSSAVSGGSNAVDDINKTLALTMARNAAIPAGQVLSQREMADLVDNLFGCSNVNYTPDGLRIFGIVSQQEIERLFD